MQTLASSERALSDPVAVHPPMLFVRRTRQLDRANCMSVSLLSSSTASATAEILHSICRTPMTVPSCAGPACRTSRRHHVSQRRSALGVGSALEHGEEAALLFVWFCRAFEVGLESVCQLGSGRDCNHTVPAVSAARKMLSAPNTMF